MTNNPLKYQISVYQWADQYPALRQLRCEVFIGEQGVSPEEEWDEHDDTALHLLATSGTQPIGCARLLADGKLTRMAVLKPYRRHGVGRSLVKTAKNLAMEAEMPQLYLHAQLQALDFYRKQGFIALGAIFMEAGIPHQEMVLALNPQASP